MLEKLHPELSTASLMVGLLLGLLALESSLQVIRILPGVIESL